MRKAIRTRYGEEVDEIVQVPLLNEGEAGVTQSTENLHIRNDIFVQKQQETVTEVENANEIKQEVEDAESSSTPALPEDELRKKRKRSPSPSDPKKSLRENKDRQRSTSKCKEVTQEANLNVEADQTFIDYNHSARKLLHSDAIPMDVVFKVFERREDSNVNARRWR